VSVLIYRCVNILPLAKPRIHPAWLKNCRRVQPDLLLAAHRRGIFPMAVNAPPDNAVDLGCGAE